MVYIEDISEEINDGFIWYSAIDNMEMFRLQCMQSSASDGHLVIMHTYDEKGNEVNIDDVETIENKVKEFYDEEVK